MKKRLLAVHHADGRTEYICQKCGTKMEWRTTGGFHFDCGEVWDDIEEKPVCPNCGMDVIELPKMKVSDFKHVRVSF